MKKQKDITHLTKTTESDSYYSNLEKMSINTILQSINKEDKKVAFAVENVIKSIEKLVSIVVTQINKGGRLFYIGAGTSGRLGILDASECPPTYGIEHGRIVGLIAGGDSAIRKAVEFAEDNLRQGWKDLKKHKINKKDVVIGIAASGSTPYVLNALKKCNEKKIVTGCIVCNAESPISKIANYPIVVVVGAEFVTGSTRMKSGTAQKLVLNMVSTAAMIKIGKVKGNKMIDMQLSNNKLVDRGTKMISKKLNIDYKIAKELLLKHKSVRKAISINK